MVEAMAAANAVLRVREREKSLSVSIGHITCDILFNAPSFY